MHLQMLVMMLQLKPRPNQEVVLRLFKLIIRVQAEMFRRFKFLLVEDDMAKIRM